MRELGNVVILEGDPIQFGFEDGFERKKFSRCDALPGVVEIEFAQIIAYSIA